MSRTRSHSILRALLLAITGVALSSCCLPDYYYGGCYRGCAPIRFCAPIRVCR